jgi:transcription antitermination factor NusG
MLRPKIQAREFLPPDLILSEASSLRWVIAMVWSGCQQRVARDLRDHGFSSYAPIGTKFANRTVGRSSGLERRVRCVISYPVLGSYVFVGHATRLAGKSMHAKIAAVLGDAEGPTLISPEAIRIIARAELDGEWDKASPRAQMANPFSIDQDVRLKDGPMAGFIGVVRSLRGELRYQIEVEMFGRPMKVTVEACQLEPAFCR